MTQTPLNCDQCRFEPFDPFADPAGFSGSDTSPPADSRANSSRCYRLAEDLKVLHFFKAAIGAQSCARCALLSKPCTAGCNISEMALSQLVLYH